MTVKDLFDDIGGRLKGAGKRWWDDNRKLLIGLAEDEVEGVLEALKNGDRVKAKMEVVAHMTPEQWRAYRDGTTEELQGIARVRASVIDAIEALGWRALRSIGAAIVAASKKDGGKGRA